VKVLPVLEMKGWKGVCKFYCQRGSLLVKFTHSGLPPMTVAIESEGSGLCMSETRAGWEQPGPSGLRAALMEKPVWCSEEKLKRG
jgi:hypothetical protein